MKFRCRSDREVAAAAHPVVAPAAPAKAAVPAPAPQIPPAPAATALAATPTLAVSPSPVPATPTTVAAPVNTDPAAGDWWTDAGAPLTLAGNHVICGRAGSWVCTATTNNGRNYALHWAHKDWVDYVVLSGEGKSLYGKSRDKIIHYWR